MMKWILVIVAAILSGCNSTESKSDPVIAYGTYQWKSTVSDGSFTIQFRFNSDKTFTGGGYVTLNNGSVDCELSETSGHYVATAGELKESERKSRFRTKCDSAFSAWEDRPDIALEIRNIAATSFELYQTADADIPAAWHKFLKI